MKILSLSLISLLLFFSFSVSASTVNTPRLNPVSKTLKVQSVSSEENSTSSVSSMSVNSSNSIKSTRKFDNSLEAIIARLGIYIRRHDASALFCEIAANSRAADLQVFSGIFDLLMEVLQSRTVRDDFNPVDFVASVFRAFIHFNVNVTGVNQLQTNSNLLKFIISRFKTLKRPFLAFFVLLQDQDALLEYSYHENANFYALHNAIMLLPTIESQIEMVSFFYQNYSEAVLYERKIIKRLFRDTPQPRLAQFLIDNGFQPVNHPHIYERCKVQITPSKWDFFSEIYGHSQVEFFVQSGLLIKPQQTDESLLPFVMFPLNDPKHPRWKVYEEAYGAKFVKPFKIKQAQAQIN